MANFLVVLDDDALRRESFVQRTRGEISPFPGLRVEGRSGPGWDVLWAAGVQAPVSVRFDEETSSDAAFVWGTPLARDGALLEADAIQERAHEGGLAQWDGFYALACLRSGAEGEPELRLAADVLGLYPVYYWQGAGVALVSSSIELIRQHPDFSARLDVHGLAGVLLSNGLLGGRSVFQGVRRLEPRHELVGTRGGLRERCLYRIPESREALSFPLEGHVERLAQSTRSAMRRQFSLADEFGLLLSGGLDSRTLAGGLDEFGKKTHAMTFGRPEENEADCARAVARELSMAHRLVDVPSELFPQAADSFAKWDALSSGFSAIPDWVMAHEANDLPKFTVLGHALDGAAGGLHVHWAYDAAAMRYRPESFMAQLNRWAFSQEQLQGLLRPDFAPAVEEVVEQFTRDFEAWATQGHLRSWHADLATRQRFHVGIALWVTSFRSWPICPALDIELLETTASLPGHGLAHRVAQTESLIRLYPRLAAIAVDRNSPNNISLTPNLKEHLRIFGRKKLHHLANRLHVPRKPPAPRFYDRLYNLDHEAWRNIRELAESRGVNFPEAVNPALARQMLPGAAEALKFSDPISEAGQIKALLGLSLVHGRTGLN